ncbi:MAG: tetratricopeptide repeat protein [Candidatus Hydrogenedentes bacterium]|nr:tetratricopeptide repeat protein [Candidatus Hydrogenedentota bacterium]
MNDLHELTEYVLEHPDDFDHRWRLAKKLYMAWEYAEALKHLLILKKEWTRKLNVLRYLAATYYRLGRYEEAITELQDIVKQWPGETAVWEQLARVAEVAGKVELAVNAWEEIHKLDPSSSIAGRSIQRLMGVRENTPRGKLNLTDSDSGINLSVARVCENCGAQNSEEFDRCWQCHALLASAPPSPLVPPLLPEASSQAWFRRLAGGLLTVCVVTASVFLALSYLPFESTAPQALAITVYDFLAAALYMSRLYVALGVFLASTLVFWGLCRFLDIKAMGFSDALVSGLFTAGVSYLATWLPVAYLALAPAAPPLSSFLVVIVFMARGNLLRLLGVWLVQGVLLTTIMVAVPASLHGWDFVTNWPEVVRFETRLSRLRASESASTVLERPAPFAYSLIWVSTGSPWLDRTASANAIEIVPTPPDRYLKVDLRLEMVDEDEHTTKWEPVRNLDTPPYRFIQPVTPGARYALRIDAPEGTTCTTTITGLLPVRPGPLE